MSDAPPAAATPPPPEPAATPAAPGEPGPVGKAARLARTVLAGTFTPRDFLARWEAEPARWASPLELLSVNGLLVGGAIYLTHLLGVAPESDPHLASIIASSKAAAVAMDAFNAILPVVAVWSQVLALRLASALVGARVGWAGAIRQAGFLAAYYVPASLLALVVGAAAGFASPAFLGVTAATLAVEWGYSWLAFRRLAGASAPRAAAGALLGQVLAVLLEQGFAMLALGAAVVLAVRLKG